ncbi:MAG: MazF family transcriptional regulator, partial [bacterium]|nr:MazF family transcriptional regulator [bacterium]
MFKVINILPFSLPDLSQAKLRPAIVLADVGKNDWILCQITSNPYGDSKAITITNDSFANGSLQVTSYTRPGKLFTSNSSLMVKQVGCLKKELLIIIIETIVAVFHSGLYTG